jgi:Na+-translocating ferredoxin:NAD+ oxidoreductase RnfG subunit
VVGYAVIDTHVVRTLPEAFLVVLSPDGRLDRLLLLAFHEPPEYQAPERWLAQFEGRDTTTEGWRIGRDLHGLTGATLTAHAVADAVRKILALHAAVIRPREDG